MEQKDIVIIGNGPAGLSAALYTCRARLDTTIIGKDNGALEKAELIENYFGLEKPLGGKELVERGKKQVAKLGVEILEEEVVSISWNDFYEIETTRRKLQAKALIMATGVSRKKAKIENLDKYEGRGISYCAICDAFFFKKKSVAVLGNSVYALKELNELLPVVEKAVILTNGLEPQADFPADVEVIKTPVKAVCGDERVEKVVFEDNKEIEVSGLFIALGSASGSDFAKKLGIAVNEKGDILIDANGKTNLEGLFAAGDCTGGLLQISKAVGDGARAAVSAIDFVRKKD